MLQTIYDSHLNDLYKHTFKQVLHRNSNYRLQIKITGQRNDDAWTDWNSFWLRGHSTETKHAGYSVGVVMRKNNWLQQRWISLYHGTKGLWLQMTSPVLNFNQSMSDGGAGESQDSNTAVNHEVLVPFTAFQNQRLRVICCSARSQIFTRQQQHLHLHCSTCRFQITPHSCRPPYLFK